MTGEISPHQVQVRLQKQIETGQVHAPQTGDQTGYRGVLILSVTPQQG